jgi:alpha-L-fucosidase
MMRSHLVAAALLAAAGGLANGAQDVKLDVARAARTKWWREARFGMFVHWGLYSQLGKGEWVMWNERIPVKEYEKLAATFNPTKFNAEAWVTMAKAAGFKYIVITAKHHDGFSMFGTKVSPFNIVDATPFKRDPMAELAAACRKHGLRLGFYYSHVREWHHPLAQSFEGEGNFGNSWDYPDESKKDLNRFIDEFVKPQLRELLTQYGPIACIWFDTPSFLSDAKARECAELVRSLQPKCLVNSNVGGQSSLWDYILVGDGVPANPQAIDWEKGETDCDSYGYVSDPNNRYKSPAEIIGVLVEYASMGGNLLLNVGPTGEGLIPEKSVETLRAVGRWMKVNGEGIYRTEASPFSSTPAWGRITRRGNRLYLHLLNWTNRIELPEASSAIRSAYLLADRSRKLTVHGTTIEIPGDAPDPWDSVVVVDLSAK